MLESVQMNANNQFKGFKSGAKNPFKGLGGTRSPPAHSIKQLEMTLAYNKSDATFGWNGFTNALRLYYTTRQETVVDKEHSYSLVEGLSPTVSYKLVETKLLGKPYSGFNLFFAR